MSKNLIGCRKCVADNYHFNPNPNCSLCGGSGFVEMPYEIKENLVLKHFKGNHYIVTGVAVDAVDGGDVVIYRRVGQSYSKMLFTRPLPQFYDIKDGKMRFTPDNDWGPKSNYEER